MMSSRLKDILEHCERHRIVCPNPIVWKGFWEMLPSKVQVDGRWQPQHSLVLTSWWASSDLEKLQRFVEHLLWADRHDGIAQVDAFLKSLKTEAGDWTDGWYISKEPLIYSPSLIAAYLTTEYVVWGERDFVLKIGIESRELIGLLERTGYKNAAFITAWNPYGRDVLPEANEVAQETLRQELKGLGHVCFDGEGRGVGNDWPPEASILALGCSQDCARMLGQKYRQNAVVWAGADAVPHLLILESESAISLTEAGKE